MNIKCGTEERKIFELFDEMKKNKKNMHTDVQEKSVLYHTFIKYCLDLQKVEIVKKLLLEMHNSGSYYYLII